MDAYGRKQLCSGADLCHGLSYASLVVCVMTSSPCFDIRPASTIIDGPLGYFSGEWRLHKHYTFGFDLFGTFGIHFRVHHDATLAHITLCNGFARMEHSAFQGCGI